MSEYAVERARQIFQARQNGQSQRARAPRLAAREARADSGAAGGAGVEAGIEADDLIGALHRMSSRLRQLDGWLREEHQLSLTEMHVLSLIPTVPPAQRTTGRGDAAARLAREAELSPSGLTRLVDRLATRGLVDKVDDSWDRRVTHLVLTEHGRAVRDAVLPRAAEHIRGCGEDRLPMADPRWTAMLPEGRASRGRGPRRRRC